MRIIKYLLLVFILGGQLTNLQACTIFSGKDKRGHVWAGNNEDGVFTFNTYVNLVVGTDSTYGYVGFTYYSPDAYIQGGENEAGLFYDGNSVSPSKYKDYDRKKAFPGGENEMIKYVLKKCKTVQEVLALFKEYRQDGLEGGQLHFADKYGNLGIIVADSMWITKADFQISTNYNLCHSNKDGQTCWRYPIAERILKSKEPGLESFREICDSTSQKSGVSTLYSNIHDLNTGDIWFYYGMDFNRPYKTSLKELLRNGNRSFLMYELFLDAPLVNVFQTYKQKGVEAGIKKLDESHLTLNRKNEILWMLSSDLILINHEFKGYPFLADLIKSKKEAENDETIQATNALALFCTDKAIEARGVLGKYLVKYPENQDMHSLLNQMQGIFDKGANVKFELPGYENAQYIFVEGFDDPSINHFLVKMNGRWTGEFTVSPGKYHYIFIVDGKRVLDSKNTDIVNSHGLEFNRIFVKP